MDDKATRAKKYRERAAEIRLIAEDMLSDNSWRLLIKIADDYDRIALGLEAMDQPERSIRKA
jgi:hypothetical protein